MSIASWIGTMYVTAVDAVGEVIDGATEMTFGEAYPLTIQTETEPVSRKSRMLATAGQIVASKNDIQSVSGAVTVYDWVPQTVAAIFSGSYTEGTGTQYTVEVGTTANVRYAIRAMLKNEFTGEEAEFVADMVLFSAAEPVNLISEEGSEGEPLSFNLTYITKPGATSPARFNREDVVV